MKIPAKITLSILEQQLITQSDWIHAKNEVIRKVILLFGHLSEILVQHPTVLPEAVRQIAPKISKGENYNGLPYVVLDYPRFFEAADVFAIRSFFWWGHFFSSTFQLKGIYYDRYAENVFNRIKQQPSVKWYINRTDEEWIHDLQDKQHWTPLESGSVFIKNEKKLLKIATALPVSEWEDALDFLKQNGVCFLDSMKQDQLPKR
jgi:hypothetical protein